MAQTFTAEDFYELGVACLGGSRWNEADEAFQKAILRKPNFPTAYNNRGNVLQCKGMHFDAVLNYNTAITLDPNSAELYNNRGAALVAMDDYNGGLASYMQSVALRPKFPEAWTNIGNCLKLLGRIPDARESYLKAIDANSAYVDAHLNLSFVELEQGNYDIGWEEYEWRWKCGQIFPRNLPFPTWNGEDLTGKSILLYGEQGLGDALQFIRYATIVKELGAREVIVEVRAPLARIARTVPGVDRVVVHGEDVTRDPIDYTCALMGCPRILKTSVETIPNKIPYFSYPETAASYWREKLFELPGIKVGIVWAGSSRPMQPAANAVDKRRSTHLMQWAPLGKVSGVTFISIQKDHPAEQALSPPAGMTIANVSDKLDDFTDTAALVSQLDLVIAVDTSIIHLVGGLGKPLWLLSRYDNCWRWLGRRKDSPWYPTLRQFIQPNPGDWPPVFEEVAEALKQFVAEKTQIQQVAA